MLNEGNKRDEHLEKKGESTKTTAMRKSSERRGRFSAGDTHQSTERENITWARPGTRPHADSLDRQRKGAHRAERGRKKPQAGSSPEDRRWDAFVGDEKKGKYQKLQDKKKKGETTNIDAQKQGIIRKGERRRELRSQAVNAIRRAMGGGYVDEGFKQADYVKMLRKEKKHQKDAFEQGPDPQELSGKYRSKSRNRAFKMADIRDAMMRGEDPRKDTRGGAFARRGNPDQDHRASYTYNQSFMPNYKKRRTKKAGVGETEDVKEAKVDDHQKLSPIEKEFVRHKRQTGFEPSSDIDKHTETRRSVHRERRGVKKREPFRDGSSTVSGKYKSKSQNQKRLKELSGKKVLRTASNKIINFERGVKTFEEFMIEARERAHKFPLSKDERETIQRIRDQLYGKKSPKSSERENSPTRSASRRKPRRLDFEVREENNLTEMPYQIYGPDPHGPSDAEPKPLGKPYKNKKRAKNRADKLDQEIGGYRHFVRKVDEEYKDLSPEKEERVKNRMGELARDIELQGARMKELRKKPFGKYRPKVKKEKEAIVKSTKKKQKLIQNASDAVIRTSVSKEAKGRKRAEELKQQLRDLGVDP